MLRLSKSISRLISRQSPSVRKPHAGSRLRRYSENDNEDDEYDNKGRDAEKNRQNHLYLYKSKGQHLLTNQRVLDTIVRKSAIKPTDTVLEIGPGTGNLTLKLLEVASKVFAIEIDSRMFEILHKRVLECGFQDRLTVSGLLTKCSMKCLSEPLSYFNDRNELFSNGFCRLYVRML